MPLSRATTAADLAAFSQWLPSSIGDFGKTASGWVKFVSETASGQAWPEVEKWKKSCAKMLSEQMCFWSKAHFSPKEGACFPRCGKHPEDGIGLIWQ